MNSRNSLWLFVSLFMLGSAVLLGNFAFSLMPQSFEVSYQEIAQLGGEVEPMESLPGTSDEDCWIQGFYQEGFIGVCMNLPRTYATFALYSYAGVPLTDFKVVEQRVLDPYARYTQPLFHSGHLEPEIITASFPSLTLAESPLVIKSGRFSFINQITLQREYPDGYDLGDGKELWLSHTMNCNHSCGTFVFVDDHDFTVIAHHRHDTRYSNYTERAVIGDFIFFVSGNDILVYDKNGSTIEIREIDFTSQQVFSNNIGQPTCQFEFIGLTEVQFHPELSQYQEEEHNLSDDYLVVSEVLIVRITSGQNSGKFVIFGNDQYRTKMIPDDHYFDIQVSPTVANEHQLVVGHTNMYRAFDTPLGSTLFYMSYSIDFSYPYNGYNSAEICNPQQFAPETSLNKAFPIIGA